MAAAKYEMEKFSGQNDFGLWILKMKAILMQQGVWEIIKDGPDQNKDDADEKDLKVLREVSKEETAAGVWVRLESLYMTKSLANYLHLKQKLLTFKILDGKSLNEQIDDFGKCLDDLENIDELIKDEDKALMLLNYLPKSYEHFKDAILLGRESKVTYEEVSLTLKLKDAQISGSVPKVLDTTGEGLNIRPAQKKNSNKKWQKKDKGGKKPEKETRECHYCHKPGHLKKNCYAWKRKQQEAEKGENNADVVQEVETDHVMNVMESDISEYWIMDNGCSFHMCPRLSWFQNIEKSSGSVLLGNNQVCKVQG